MSLALDDKQFIRSIADLIINNPEAAQQFFLATEDVSGVEIFSSISDLIQYVKSDSFNYEMTQPEYLNYISAKIENIKDKEVKDIFLTSQLMSTMSAP